MSKNALKSIGIDALIMQIKEIVDRAKKRIASTLNQELLLTYWQIGKIITQHNSPDEKSDRAFILEISKILTKELGKGYSRSNLFNMRNFFLAYPDVQTLSGQISWSHYCELISVDDVQARGFYEKEAIGSSWSVRELRRQIDSSLFERLLLSKGELNKKAVLEMSKNGQVVAKPEDILKEPYVLEFLGMPDDKPFLEKDLEAKIIRHIEDFLLELGKGFMFVGSQVRVRVGDKPHRVDMVFYNKILKAYVLFDLKRRKLEATDVGQMNLYLNYYKTEVNDPGDNEPIGIILCARKDEIVAEYALGGLTNQIFASKYVFVLPEKEELVREVKRVIEANSKKNKA